MSDVNLSKNGVFFDSKNGKVVESQPEEGVQIVAPGAEITPALQEDIDRWKDVESGTPAAVETVSTSAVKSAKK